MEPITVPDWALILTIFILLITSAYFASSETAMMKLNVYRLRALVRKRHGGAQRTHQLLQQKDRLLGVILIYNNLVNFSAAVVASVLFTRWLGTEVGGVVTTVTITLMFLIFAEVAPKTIAAVRPESIAYPSAYLLVPLLAISKYMVLFINFCGAFVVKPFIKDYEDDDDDLSEEELRQVFEKARKLPRNRREMLSNILDLEEEKVGDVMVPREAIYGINLEDSLDEIRERINNSNHTRLPVYRGTINEIEGVLHMREANRLLQKPSIEKDDILGVLENTYYTPSRIPLSRLASNFRQRRHRFTIAVDEYGVVVGLITIDDIIEEIVGEFTEGTANVEGDSIDKIGDDTYRVTGNTLLHEINHATNLTLPEDGPRTVNGWVLDHLRRVPEGHTSMLIDNVRVEILEVADNAIKSAEIKFVADANDLSDTTNVDEPPNAGSTEQKS